MATPKAPGAVPYAPVQPLPHAAAPEATPSQAQAQAQVQACRYKTGKTLGAGSYSVVKECVHIDTGRYYAAKVINKRLMAGREHMVSRRALAAPPRLTRPPGAQRDRGAEEGVDGPPEHPDPGRLL